MKNILIVLITIIVFTANTTVALAQNTDQYHAKLTEYHSHIQNLLSKSIEGTRIIQKTHARNAEETRKLLESAKIILGELKTLAVEQDKPVTQLYQSIERLYGQATRYNVLMQLEASKTDFDENKLKEYARDMYKSIEKIEKEHQDLTLKTCRLFSATPLLDPQ